MMKKSFIKPLLGILLSIILLIILMSLPPAAEAAAALTEAVEISAEYLGETVAFTVKRADASTEETFSYRTVSGTALAGTHFLHTEGELTFLIGEDEKLVYVSGCDGAAAFSALPLTAFVGEVDAKSFLLEVIDGGGDVYSASGAIPTQNKIDAGIFSKSKNFVLVDTAVTLSEQSEYMLMQELYYENLGKAQIKVNYDISQNSANSTAFALKRLSTGATTVLGTYKGSASGSFSFGLSGELSDVRLLVKGNGTYRINSLSLDISITEGSAPKLLDVLATESVYKDGQTVYLSLVYDKIVAFCEESAVISTDMGDFLYSYGAGTNVLVFYGIYEKAGDSLTVLSSSINATDYSGNTVDETEETVLKIFLEGAPDTGGDGGGDGDGGDDPGGGDGGDDGDGGGSLPEIKLLKTEYDYSGKAVLLDIAAEESYTVSYHESAENAEGKIDAVDAINAGKYYAAIVGESGQIIINEFSINRVNLTVTATQSLSKVYDNTDNCDESLTEGTHYTVSGLVSGEVYLTDACYNDKSVSAAKTVTAKINLTDSQNYIFDEYLIFSASITKREVSFAPLADFSKEYDGTTYVGTVPTEGIHYKQSGLLGGDTAVLSNIAYNSAEVAEADSVTANIFIAGGNYEYPTQLVFSAEITKRRVAVSPLKSLCKTFDGTTDIIEELKEGTHYAVSGLIEGRVTLTDARYNDKNVSAAEYVTVRVDIPDTKNYVCSESLIFAASITKRSVSFRTLVCFEKEYDGTAAVAETLAEGVHYEQSGLIGGDIAVLSSIFYNSKNAFDAYKVTAEISISSDNYTHPSQLVFSAAIMKKYVAASPATELKKVYDGTALYDGVLHSLISTTGFFDEEITVLSAAFSSSGTDCTSAKIRLSVAENGNFYCDATITANASIAPKNISVTAVSASVVYGACVPKLSYEADGLVKGDTLLGCLDVLADEAQFRLIGGEKILDAEEYVIFSTLFHPCYDISYTEGTLTVEKKRLTARVNDASSVYGDTASEYGLTVTFGEVLFGDVLSIAFPLAKVLPGSYEITAAAEHKNYDITVISGAHTVEKRKITVAAKESYSVYGEAAVLGYGLSSGTLVDGDLLDGGLFIGGTDVGCYEIASSLGHPYYETTFLSAQHTVLPKKLTAAIKEKAFTYGEEIKFSEDDYSISETFAYDDSPIFEFVFDAATVPGTYSVGLICLNKNYELTVEDAEFFIKKAKPVIVVDEESLLAAEDGKTHFISASCEGLTLRYSIDGREIENGFASAGEYTVVLSADENEIYLSPDPVIVTMTVEKISPPETDGEQQEQPNEPDEEEKNDGEKEKEEENNEVKPDEDGESNEVDPEKDGENNEVDPEKDGENIKPKPIDGDEQSGVGLGGSNGGQEGIGSGNKKDDITVGGGQNKENIDIDAADGQEKSSPSIVMILLIVFAAVFVIIAVVGVLVSRRS